MNLENFKDLLCKSLYISCEGTLNSLTAVAPELKIKGLAETNNFIYFIRRRCGKIYHYVIKQEKTEPLRLKATTNNFVFTYIVNTNNTSTLEIKMMIASCRNYDAGFLSHKVINLSGYVYFIKSEYGYKIGCTKNLKDRVKMFNVKLPFKIEQHSHIECVEYEKLESFLHEKLSHKRLNGEWFDLNDSDFNEIDIILKNMKLKRVSE